MNVKLIESECNCAFMRPKYREVEVTIDGEYRGNIYITVPELNTLRAELQGRMIPLIKPPTSGGSTSKQKASK